MIVHPIEPVYDADSEILILGSFPSVKSREYGFFYGHPQNRFWKVLAQIFGEEIPVSIEEKKSLLLRNHVAVWDVIASCDITGSADSTIKNVVANDISGILGVSRIKKIFVNGKKAEQLYNKYIYPQIEIEAEVLPSTSPANAAWKIDDLIEEWRKIDNDKPDR